MADDFAGSTATLGAINIGGTTTGSIEQAGDSDWFKVSLTANTTYLFRLEGSNAGAGTLGTGAAVPLLGLRTSSGSFIKSVIFGSSVLEPVLLYTPATSGDYFLDVKELAGTGTGSYRLRAELGLPDDFGENASTTGLLNVGGIASGNIEQSGDSDWFKVYLSAGKTYSLSLEGSNSGGGTLGIGAYSPYLDLYSPTGTYIDGTATGSPAGEPLLSYTPQTSGYYFLEASETLFAGTGTYRLRAELTPKDDYADNIGTTGVLTMGAEITGALEQVHDKDWFKVHLTGGSQYVFNLMGADSGGGTLGTGTAAPYLTIYASNGSVIKGTSTGSTAGEPQLNITASLTGDYFLGVSELSDTSTGTYTLRAAEVTSEPVSPPSYTVSGTLGNDVFVPAAGNSYRGGAGGDTYIISAGTLSGAVTASIVDTEGSNLIQLVDGLTIASSAFYADAAQLTLSTGAVLQILGASKFNFQVGANLVAGDGAPIKSYADFAAALGGSLPAGSVPAAGSINYKVPTAFDPAASPTPALPATAVAVSGTLGRDICVITAGHNYLGGKGDDIYIVGSHSLAGAVTATISDTEGSNTIQLVDGSVISSSSFLNDAVQLTLSTGAKVQILGASKFSFQVGANAPGGDSASSLGYAQFASALGAAVPAAGAGASSGTADFIVPVSSGSGSMSGNGTGHVTDLGSNTDSGMGSSMASDSGSSILAGASLVLPHGAAWPQLSGVIEMGAAAWAAAAIPIP